MGKIEDYVTLYDGTRLRVDSVTSFADAYKTNIYITMPNRNEVDKFKATTSLIIEEYEDGQFIKKYEFHNCYFSFLRETKEEVSYYFIETNGPLQINMCEEIKQLKTIGNSTNETVNLLVNELLPIILEELSKYGKSDS